MYEATTISEFKKKLIAYDLIYAKYSKNKEDFSKKQTDSSMQKKEIQTRCFNCGEFHPTNDCPNKERGPKCFRCNRFGHKSTACSQTKPEERARMNIMRAFHRPTTEIKLNDRKVLAHVDSQSDFTVVRENLLKDKRIPTKLRKCSEEVKGVGGSTQLKQEFNGKIQIENDTFNLNCYTISEKD